MSGNPQTFGVGGVQTLVDAATITLNLANLPAAIAPATTPQIGMGNSFAVTLGGNRTLNILNQTDGQVIRLFVTQDGTGSRTLSVQSNGTAGVQVGGASQLSTTAGAVDLVEIEYRADQGKSYVTVLGKAYS